MPRKRQGVTEDNTTAVVLSYDPSTHKGTYTPNASNYYLLATTKFTWVKYEVDTATKKISRYVVWHRGTVAVYTTEEANNYVNLEWQEYPDENKTAYTTTADMTMSMTLLWLMVSALELLRLTRVKLLMIIIRKIL